MKLYKHLDWNKPLAGEVGIEVEMEGLNLPKDPPLGWTIHREGSLRDGWEYVLKKPISAQDVEKKLTSLWKCFKEAEAKLIASHRCSVHIHVNVQDMEVVEVFNFMVLYLILEDALVRFCGDGREGNLFCLRARDAEYVIDAIEEAARIGEFYPLHTDRLRYSAMNCKAIMEKGSLEFRALRGTTDWRVIKTWVGVLLRIRDAASLYKAPDQIINGFSEGGEEHFCRDVVGDEAFDLLFRYPNWKEHVRQGMRRSQCIAYSGNWAVMGWVPPADRLDSDIEEQELKVQLRQDDLWDILNNVD